MQQSVVTKDRPRSRGSKVIFPTDYKFIRLPHVRCSFLPAKASTDIAKAEFWKNQQKSFIMQFIDSGMHISIQFYYQVTLLHSEGRIRIYHNSGMLADADTQL